MSQEQPKEQVSFEINPAVVFRLGAELITDTVQALVELVKNSYDADASLVTVKITTNSVCDMSESYPNAIGSIVITDDGVGMSDNTIREGWLTIANSPKLKAKAENRVTTLGRTPLGDKGLGRLGIQRLAHNLEIITRPKDEKNTENYVAFSWRDFERAKLLSDVHPTVKSRTIASDRKHGTELILTDLKDVDSWTDRSKINSFHNSISALISPFDEVRDFKVLLEIDGRMFELAEITKKTRDAAVLRYTFNFDGEVLTIIGTGKLDYLKPDEKEKIELLQSILSKDNGIELFSFLSTKFKNKRPPTIRHPNDQTWYIEYEKKIILTELDKHSLIGSYIANPGSFHGEIDQISLVAPTYSEHAFDSLSDLKEIVKQISGIRVYRDGFGIRVDDDWLKLGHKQSRDKSYYGLRPGNVIGYVALSAKANAKLEETTSREGFQKSPYYDNFYLMMDEVVKFAGDSQDFLRRGTLDYLKKYEEKDARSDENEDPRKKAKERSSEVEASFDKGKQLLIESKEKIATAEKNANYRVQEIRNLFKSKLETEPNAKAAIESYENEFRQVVLIARTELDKFISFLDTNLSKSIELRKILGVLDGRWQVTEEQMSMMYESASLGITAEALTHEISNISDSLYKRCTMIAKEIKNNKLSYESTELFVEYVKSSISALRKQTSHLSPALRYVREQREIIKMSNLMNDLSHYYQERLSKKNITFLCEVIRDFDINFNRGKIVQIFDNFVLNSEYWLSEENRVNRFHEGNITFKINKPRIQIFDNGRGIDPNVQDKLFDAFVSTKKNGRGLGLFIVNQLLSSERCDAVLLPTKNESKRRFIFELDLTGALHG